MSGLPLTRPLWLEYPEDMETFTIEDEFLLGSDLLVHGVFDDVSAPTRMTHSSLPAIHVIHAIHAIHGDCEGWFPVKRNEFFQVCWIVRKEGNL